MKFNIRGSKLKVTEPIRNYIEEKIGKLDKYFENPNDVTASVVIRVKGKDQIVEVTIPIKKIILRGEEAHGDLYAAVDLVSDKIERQIRKNKTRLKKINKKTDIEIMTNFESQDEDEKFKIVKRKVIETKPMSEEEAILQMNLLDHEFFVFINEKDGTTCVLYRRKDKDYGIMQTK